jgi:hypothetical protein
VEERNWRAEPANTPIVEQARGGVLSVPMALVFERCFVGAGGRKEFGA